MGILIFFAVASIFAPIITPYSPTADTELAGFMAAPSWLRNLPSGGLLSENFKAVEKPGFATLESLQEWNITTEQDPSMFTIQHSSSIGYPDGTGPGSIAVTFRREETGKVYGNVSVKIAKEFYYPYKGLPNSFKGLIALLVKGTETEAFLHVPVRVEVFIQKVGGGKWTIWPANDPGRLYEVLAPFNYYGEITSVTPTWTVSRATPASPASQIDSRAYSVISLVKDPLRTIFKSSELPCSYIFGAEIKFYDKYQPNKQVETTVYVDDLYLNFAGTSFGILGTDATGRDIFSQLIYGARISLYLGLLSSIFAVVVGLFVGLAAGYLGKVVDAVLMRFTDMLLVLPTLPLLIVVVAVLGPSLNNLILILGALGWMGFARTVRSQVLTLRERPFVEAAKSIGAGKIHIIIRHILPNVMSLTYVSLATAVPGNIVAEAALSWLGFYDPNVMTWGRMLYDVQVEAGAISNWWWVLPPGIAIALIALSFILIGYALDEVLNPRLRMRR